MFMCCQLLKQYLLGCSRKTETRYLEKIILLIFGTTPPVTMLRQSKQQLVHQWNRNSFDPRSIIVTQNTLDLCFDQHSQTQLLIGLPTNKACQFRTNPKHRICFQNNTPSSNVLFPHRVRGCWQGSYELSKWHFQFSGNTVLGSSRTLFIPILPKFASW